MACVPTVPITRVYPSAGARATSSVPMEPPAPARFSMMTGCPSDLDMASAIIRDTVSVVVPGPNGTIIFIGRSGKAAARAGWAAAPSAQAPRASTARARRTELLRKARGQAKVGCIVVVSCIF